MDDGRTTNADGNAVPRIPGFDTAFQERLEELLLWRRDVRRFRTEPLEEGLIEQLLALAALSPSVGNSQPWRFVLVDDAERRARVRADFQACNAEALSDFSGEQAKLYATLKLSGLDDAPSHIAVFADTKTALGHGLGSKTMPETLVYSVVGAVQTLWLAARAHGVGLGWVSILNADRMAEILDVPKDWTFVAYLCLGRPVEEHIDPELERAGWQERVDAGEFIVRR